MKRKLLYILLAFEAIFCIAFSLAKLSLGGVFSTVITFPFEQIALGLQLLSMSGRIGNAFSLVLYAAICALPAFFLYRAGSKRKLQAEDALLGLLSAALFVSLYLMINPGYIGNLWNSGGSGATIGKVILGGTLWSIVFGYLVLRVLRLSFESGTDKLEKYVGVLLCTLNFFFVWIVFVICFGDLLGSFSSVKEGNTGSESGLGATYFFLVLRFMVDALPYILDAVTVFLALDLLASMRVDRYSEQTEILAIRLSRWCGKALSTVVISGIVLNLLQLVFAGMLRNIDSSFVVPVSSVLFVLAILFFARLISENRKLKSDNDLFI